MKRLLLALVLFLGLGHVLYADSFVFTGTDGGLVSYAGGASSLIGANLPINQVFAVPPGSSSAIQVVGGLLNFATGVYSGINLDLGTAFLSLFGAGGSLAIVGTVPDAGIGSPQTLLAGTFLTPPIFSYGGSGQASLAGITNITSLSPALANFFGFGTNPDPDLGAFAETSIEVTFSGGNANPGIGFVGSQGNVAVTAHLTPGSGPGPLPADQVPEPASLLLLGSGLLGLGGFARRKLKRKETRSEG